MKKITVLVLAVILVFSGLINSFANVSIDEKTLNDKIEIQLNSGEKFFIKENQNINVNATGINNLVLTKVVLNNPKYKEFVNEAFRNGAKIFIKDSNLSRNDVRRYFGLKEKNLWLKAVKIPRSAKMKSTSTYRNLNKLV